MKVLFNFKNFNELKYLLKLISNLVSKFPKV